MIKWHDLLVVLEGAVIKGNMVGVDEINGIAWIVSTCKKNNKCMCVHMYSIMPQFEKL